MMVYYKHLKANWKVAGRGLILALFHFIHGVIPCKMTSHEYWKI